MSLGVPSFHGSRRTKPNLCSAISRFSPVLAEELITDAETVGAERYTEVAHVHAMLLVEPFAGITTSH